MRESNAYESYRWWQMFVGAWYLIGCHMFANHGE